MTIALRDLARQVVDALAFTGVWAGLTAGSLTFAAGRAIVPAASPRSLAAACSLAIAGAVVVYVVDRLRDRERDAPASPARSEFVSRHLGAMRALTLVAGAGALALALSLPATVWVLCGAIAGLGLLHRRLKRAVAFEPVLYVTASWVAIVVGLPLLAAPGADAGGARVIACAAALALAIAANAIGSELRGVRYDARAATRLRRARGLALGAVALSLLVPGLRPLAIVGALAWLALVFFRPDERYGLLVLDGALLLGGLVAGALLLTPTS